LENHTFKELELPHQDFEHLILELNLIEMGYESYFKIENGYFIFKTLGVVEYIKRE